MKRFWILSLSVSIIVTLLISIFLGIFGASFSYQASYVEEVFTSLLKIGPITFFAILSFCSFVYVFLLTMKAISGK